MLLLTVAFFPFPTALPGEFIFTDHSAPAVVLYNATIAIQSLRWIFMSGTIIKNNLIKDERTIVKIREYGKFGYFALLIYSLCAVAAFWFPVTIAIITILIWIFWLILGINMKHE